MKASANTFGHANLPGREWLARAVVGAALVTVAAGALAPAEVSAHAGEVHSDPPDAGAPANNAGGSGDRARAGAGGKMAPSEDSSGARSEGNEGADATGAPASTPPPVPEEPDSDPLLHFAALGVAVVAGLGLLLVRRRRLEA